MKRTAGLLALVAAGAGVVGAVNAGAIEDVMKIQRNGMWQMKPPGYSGKPYLFCVTDSTKIGGLAETREAVKTLGCKTEKDSLHAGEYEIVLACASANPAVGRFRMVMKGTARADYQTGTTIVSGGGRMIQAMFPNGQQGGGEFRWLRPCKPGEKPGLQVP